VIVAADYPLLNVFWTIIIVFAWVAWFWVLIIVISDLFSRHDIGGWAKAFWMLFVIVVPFLGVFIYVISQGKGMTERRNQQVKASQQEFDSYVRQVAASDGPADQIAKAKQLLDNGTIDQAEFDRLKAQALASAQ
jgi:putative oligomerization/nucleic acid binding protein/phospholipase D-like protein